MKLVNFVISIHNHLNLDQKDVYYKILRHFDVVDAVMCINGDCLAVCKSAVTHENEPVDFLNFINHNDDNDEHDMKIVDQYEDVELLLDRIYNVVEMYNFRQQ
uniref:Ac117 n=1 Tax=Spodoptera frugiperda nuclear polyhedrosis virus TaxID=10455 RepID=A0A7G3W7P7_NPVSF|nr:hypothetical protein [Spodoptera frugiperda multiple nucleopolyhedrovirus]